MAIVSLTKIRTMNVNARRAAVLVSYLMTTMHEEAIKTITNACKNPL